MPIPRPQQQEEKEEFIERCMEDATMIREYEEEDVRLAICETQYDDNNG